MTVTGNIALWLYTAYATREVPTSVCIWVESMRPGIICRCETYVKDKWCKNWWDQAEWLSILYSATVRSYLLTTQRNTTPNCQSMHCLYPYREELVKLPLPIHGGLHWMDISFRWQFIKNDMRVTKTFWFWKRLSSALTSNNNTWQLHCVTPDPSSCICSLLYVVESSIFIDSRLPAFR